MASERCRRRIGYATLGVRRRVYPGFVTWLERAAGCVGDLTYKVCTYNTRKHPPPRDGPSAESGVKRFLRRRSGFWMRIVGDRAVVAEAVRGGSARMTSRTRYPCWRSPGWFGRGIKIPDAGQATRPRLRGGGGVVTRGRGVELPLGVRQRRRRSRLCGVFFERF